MGSPHAPSEPDARALATLMAKNPSLAAFVSAAQADGSDDSTVVVSGSGGAGPALPFGSSASEARDVADPDTQAPPPSSPRGGTVVQPRTRLHTENLSFEHGEREALPFGRGPVATPRSATFEDPPTMDISALPELAAAPVASGVELPPHLAALAIDRYAALDAQCRVWPDWRASIEQSFGIQSPLERQLLDAHWHRRFAVDAQLEQLFRWHREQHEQWERSRPR